LKGSLCFYEFEVLFLMSTMKRVFSVTEEGFSARKPKRIAGAHLGGCAGLSRSLAMIGKLSPHSN
jgi:hypothetical protein